jgi:hypothetical protein
MASTQKYRLTGDDLMLTLDNWDSLMNFNTRLIACGGTAMTLLNIKDSTKDIDFVVPVENEYKRLMKFLKQIGYHDGGGGLQHPDDPNFIYQFWSGNQVFTTNLLDPILDQGKHIVVKEWRYIYLGAINLMDLIITKMFRGTSVDISDCIAIFTTGEIDAEQLLVRYRKTAQYDLNPDKVMKNFIYFIEKLFEKQMVSDEFLKKVKSCL